MKLATLQRSVFFISAIFLSTQVLAQNSTNSTDPMGDEAEDMGGDAADMGGDAAGDEASAAAPLHYATAAAATIVAAWAM